MQLVPLPRSGLLPRLEQELGPDAAAFQLVHRGQQLLQKGGAAGRAGVHGELAGHGPHRPVHHQDTPSRVQLGLPHATRRQEHPVTEAAEGEHLGVEGDTVPAEAAQGPLRLVGLLFGHHQDLALVRPSPAQPLEHLGGLSAPGPAQNQSQHVVLPLSHFVSVLIIPHLGVQKKTFFQEGSFAACRRRPTLPMAAK